MKCINCGHELEPGSGFCENCGMLISMDNDNKPEDIYSQTPLDDEDIVVIPAEESKPEPQAELGGDDTGAERPKENEPHSEQDDSAAADGDESAEPESDKVNDIDEPFDVGTDAETPEPDEDKAPAEPKKKRTADAVESVKKIKVYNDGMDDQKGSKKGVAAIAVMIVLIVIVVAVGTQAVKHNFAGGQRGTSDPQSQNASDIKQPEDTTEKNNKKPTDKSDDSSKNTGSDADSKTTAEKRPSGNVAPSSSARPAATEPKTSGSQAAKPSSSPNTTARPSASRPGTTVRPSSTRPNTTVRPSDTQPHTTVPSTTRQPSSAAGTSKPSTSGGSSSATTADPYGFNNVPVQKPDNISKKPYKVYVTTSALTMRNKPSVKGERVVYLPIGTSCTVYASQSGFLYVRSDRYGVYGWVSVDYVSKTRPESETTTVVPNLKLPDKTYSEPQTKYVTAAEGLRLRKGPGEKYDIILLIDKGFPVRVTGYNSEVSGWVYVTDTTHGVNGWVSSDYIK